MLQNIIIASGLRLPFQRPFYCFQLFFPRTPLQNLSKEKE